MIDWTAVAAVEAGFAGIATAIAAAVTARMATETRAVAVATQEGAEAARSEAEAAREAAEAAKEEAEATRAMVAAMREDREVSSMPALASTGGVTEYVDQRFADVMNVGLGPALGCTYAARNRKTGAFFRSALFHIAASDTVARVEQVAQKGPAPDQWFANAEGIGPDVALFCRDVLDRRLRFLQWGDHVSYPDIVPKEVWAVRGSLAWWNDVDLWPPASTAPPA